MKPYVQERIGIYGGTFDPIHYGHLKVAAAIWEAFSLDRFLFVPAFIPPHKRTWQISASYHRYAMVVLATLNPPQLANTRFAASTIELEAPSRPYTIETLQQLQTIYPAAELFFVMGADSFAEVNLWREYERLLTEYNIIVAARPPATGLSAQHLSAKCQQRVIDLRGSKRPFLDDVSEPNVFLTDYVAVNIAATDVRAAVRTGQPIDEMVPPDVARYIRTYDLYRN
ncbi:MAG: nicotinate (nicotinamide) nucleotide adenylyltransferase [Acidobacteria bacterium]|nr:nicotinate (nicotinamide) nucleotide adenylyltransferase [Acidobacteriota bacterium]